MAACCCSAGGAIPRRDRVSEPLFHLAGAVPRAMGLFPFAIQIGVLFGLSGADMKFDGRLAFMILIFGVGLGVASAWSRCPRR